MLGRDFTAGGQHARRREGRDHRLRHLAARLRRRAGHRRQERPHQRQAGDDHRRHAARASRSRRTKSSGCRSTASSRRGRATTRRTSTRRCSACSSPACRSTRPTRSSRRSRKRFAAAYPDTNKQFNTGQVEPLIKTFTPRPLRGTLLTMLGFCVGVLLIACVNVMNMQFARATLRAKELAVRSSLGATRMRLIRQMLTESLLVAGIGAGVGIGLAYLSIDWLSATVRNLDNPPPSWITFDVDALVLACHRRRDDRRGGRVRPAAGVDVVARQRRRRARDGGRGNTSRGVNLISRGLVVFQIVVTCVLLIGSLLQVRSILKQQTIDYGYDTAGDPVGAHGADGRRLPDAGRAQAVLRPAAARAARRPGVRRGRAHQPLPHGVLRQRADRDRRQDLQGERDRPNANFEQVTGSFFDVTGQRLLEGRTFTDDDSTRGCRWRSSTPRSRGSTSAARAPIGRRFRTVDQQTARSRGRGGRSSASCRPCACSGRSTTRTSTTPASTCRSTRRRSGPALPAPFVSQFATVVVKPRGGQRADALANALRREVAKADPNLPLYFVGTPEASSTCFVAQNRIIAIDVHDLRRSSRSMLASVGIYGVMSFSVNQRDAGVRRAHGARRQRRPHSRDGAAAGRRADRDRAGSALGAGVRARDRRSATGIQNTLFGVSAARSADLRRGRRRSSRSCRWSRRSCRRGARRASTR